MQFGDWLVSKMIMRFSSNGDLMVDVMTEDMGGAKSADAVKAKLDKIRKDKERETREYEEAMTAAIASEVEKERRSLRSQLEAAGQDHDDSSEDEAQAFTFSSAGDAAAAAAAAASKAAREAKEAVMKAASEAKAALGKMFTWGKKEK